MSSQLEQAVAKGGKTDHKNKLELILSVQTAACVQCCAVLGLLPFLEMLHGQSRSPQKPVREVGKAFLCFQINLLKNRSAKPFCYLIFPRVRQATTLLTGPI